MEITQIIKRDYETSPFVLNKISNAIEKAMLSVGNGKKEDANLPVAANSGANEIALPHLYPNSVSRSSNRNKDELG